MRRPDASSLYTHSTQGPCPEQGRPPNSLALFKPLLDFTSKTAFTALEQLLPAVLGADLHKIAKKGGESSGVALRSSQKFPIYIIMSVLWVLSISTWFIISQ